MGGGPVWYAQRTRADANAPKAMPPKAMRQEDEPMTATTPRWKYRFKNFSRAYALLREANDKYTEGAMNQLEMEGMVQRFEYCMELSWKTAKDYLEYNNTVFQQITPRAVIKEAVAAKLITDGEGWMTALDVRNKMSHTYNFDEFESAIVQINAQFMPCFEQLYETLAAAHIDDE